MKHFKSILLYTWLTTALADNQQHPIKSAKETCLQSHVCWPSLEQWDHLNSTVNGNLIMVYPAAQSCYAPTYHKDTCSNYQRQFLSDIHRGSHIGNMQNTNWETCGDDQCLLNSILPSLPQFLSKCRHGALPRYALNSTSVEEMATIMQFAQQHHIAFNIKNTGHDFLGRSTSPDSITVWTQPLQKIEFHETYQPDQCETVSSQRAFTFGGGVRWVDAYRAAHEHNVTIVGGAQAGVGVAGGWLAGGGHSILTAAYGLGVDQVLQFKVVLSNGDYVTANACQHPDLFWALRGGGGGSYGIVTEVSMKVYPHMTLQSTYAEIFAPGNKRALMLEFARHSERWAEEGWGGYFYYYGHAVGFLYANPLLTADEAEASMKPFFDYLSSEPWIKLKKVEYKTYDGYYDLFINKMKPNSEIVGFGARIASRLIPRELFATNETREQLIDAFIEGTQRTRPLSYLLPTQILATTSLRVHDKNRETSVQPLFRKSVWHMIFTTGWIQGSPTWLKRQHSIAVSEAADPIRQLTPGGGAYMNEADVLEPSWRESFWGSNYDRLVDIKNKYDPENFFHCWKCIGWNEDMINDRKYRCYQY